MKRSLTTVALAAALLGLAAPAASARTECTTVTVPAVPAVYETVTTPAVTVIEYEFIQRNTPEDVPGQGAGTSWHTDPNWNAQDNPNSQGWTATGNTRLKVLVTEKTTVTLITPEVPASSREECIELPDGVSPVKPGDPEVPLGNLDPVAAPAEAPAAPAPVIAPAPAQQAVTPQVVAPPAEQVAYTQPEELAYTGAADWVFPAGALLLAAGAGTVLLNRRTAQ